MALPPDPIPGILPGGGISLLAGLSGTGKTTLIAQIARWVCDRQPVFGHQLGPIPMQGVLSADRSWVQDTALWFTAAGLPEIPWYSFEDDEAFNPKRFRRKWDRVSLLAEGIDHLQLPPGSLLYVDTLALFLGGNLLDYDTCAIAAIEIRRLLQERGLSLIGTCHAGKHKADRRQQYLRLQDRILGSAAQHGYSDTQMYLACPAELEYEHGQGGYLFAWHPHHAPAESFVLERDPKTGLFIPQDGIALEAGRDLVFSWIPDSATGIATLELVERAEEQGLSRKTVQRRLVDLLRDGLIERPVKGRYRKTTTH